MNAVPAIPLTDDIATAPSRPVSFTYERNSSRLSWALEGARCSSVVRAFAHGAMGRRIDPSWGGPIELFLVPASLPRLV